MVPLFSLPLFPGVDQEQYEAARVDGAGRWKLMWHITLPAIRGTIVIMLILKVGQILNTGFEQIYLMQNSLNRTASEVFDTYIYREGVQNGDYSLGARCRYVQVHRQSDYGSCSQ